MLTSLIDFSPRFEFSWEAQKKRHLHSFFVQYTFPKHALETREERGKISFIFAGIIEHNCFITQ